MFVIIFAKTMYNKAITRFSFCDILNNQGLDNAYLNRDFSCYYKNVIQ